MIFQFPHRRHTAGSPMQRMPDFEKHSFPISPPLMIHADESGTEIVQNKMKPLSLTLSPLLRRGAREMYLYSASTNMPRLRRFRARGHHREVWKSVSAIGGMSSW